MNGSFVLLSATLASHVLRAALEPLNRGPLDGEGRFGKHMYCPKCANPLERIGNELTCRKGQMGLSKAMEAGLQAAFVDRTISPHEKPFSFRIGGTWFCPGDGLEMAPP